MQVGRKVREPGGCPGVELIERWAVFPPTAPFAMTFPTLLRGCGATVLLGALPFAQHVPTQPDAAALLHRIERLGVVGSALYVAAHPDDENTRLISAFANGRKVHTAYLSLTRGDGGQNLIGPELGDALGLLRTQELLEARRIDGGEQFFTRAVDFGYSKNPEETLAKWGEDAVLEDVVRVVRTVQPDVIVTRFPTDGGGGHGHHTSSALLAHRAFELAGDPDAYPQQLAEGLAPWQPRRLFFNSSTWWNRDLPERVANDPEGWAVVEVGGFDALLGASYTELAGRSRSQHKSQGFGAAETRGSQLEYLRLEKGDALQTTDPFEGVDLSWSRYASPEHPEWTARLAALDARSAALVGGFDVREPQASLTPLLELEGELQALAASAHPASLRARRRAAAARELALQLCGVVVEARSSAASVAQGQEVPAFVRVLQREAGPTVRLASVTGPDGASRSLERTLPLNEQVDVPLEGLVAPRVVDQPYWLTARAFGKQQGGALYDPSGTGALGVEPRVPGALRVAITLELNGTPVDVERELTHTWVDRVDGERRRATVVTPIASLLPVNRVEIVTGERVEVAVDVEPLVDLPSAVLEVEAPAGWELERGAGALEALVAGERRRVFLGLRRTPDAVGGPLRFVLRAEAGESALTRHVIDYDHVFPQTWYEPAAVRLVPLDVVVDVARVGYLEGVGDAVPEALERLGVTVERLDPESLEAGDLSRFDAIVTGIRAYNKVRALARVQPLLLDYAADGGTLVLQYNTSGRDLVLAPESMGPYPFSLSRGRVTVEEAPVTLLDPDHPLLRTPNRIATDDFEGWVQERGLYFTANQDPRYAKLLSWNDPGEAPLDGALIACDHGEGRFVYTSISFFRQLPAGVPGAYRLLANLISRRSVGQ